MSQFIGALPVAGGLVTSMTDELDALLVEADQVDGSTAPTSEPNQDQRPAVKGPAPEYQPDAEIIGALKVVLMMAGNGLASYYGSEHWNLDENQANAIAVPLDAVLSKYLGSGYQLPPEVTLIMALGAVFVPKYQQQMALEYGKESEPQQSEPSQPVSGG